MSLSEKINHNILVSLIEDQIEWWWLSDFYKSICTCHFQKVKVLQKSYIGSLKYATTVWNEVWLGSRGIKMKAIWDLVPTWAALMWEESSKGTCLWNQTERIQNSRIGNNEGNRSENERLVLRFPNLAGLEDICRMRRLWEALRFANFWKDWVQTSECK